MSKLNIIKNECYIRKTENIKDPAKKASFKYQYHPSIINTKNIMKSKNIYSLSFRPVSIDKVKDIIKTLSTKKAYPDGDITVKLIKMNEDIFSRLIFRPVSILPVISKIYERLMYGQMYKHFDQIFSKFQCCFRKGFSTQNCLSYT